MNMPVLLQHPAISKFLSKFLPILRITYFPTFNLSLYYLIQTPQCSAFWWHQLAFWIYLLQSQNMPVCVVYIQTHHLHIVSWSVTAYSSSNWMYRSRAQLHRWNSDAGPILFPLTVHADLNIASQYQCKRPRIFQLPPSTKETQNAVSDFDKMFSAQRKKFHSIFILSILLHGPYRQISIAGFTLPWINSAP